MDFRLRDFMYPFEILKLKRELDVTEKLTAEEMLEYQNQKIRELIDYAYKSVPYYKEVFDSHNIDPSKIGTVKDLPAIPVLTKEILRERFDDLVCDKKNFRRNKPLICHSSGTTGTSIKFYHDRYTNISKFTFFWRMWEWAGYRPGDRWAVIGTSYLNNNKLFNYKRSVNALYISIFKIDKINSLKILDELIKFRCKILRGNPSAICNFLSFIEQKEKIQELKLRSVICVSENLQDFQRKYIESVLKVKVYNMYSQWEHVCLAMECNNGNIHHQMENGVLEILDNEDNVLEDGSPGEMVATGFYNRTMPLIRYKTGDLAVKRKSDCDCKRAHNIIERLDGRVEETVITPDNRSVSALGVAFKNNKGFNIAQIVQDHKDSIDVKLVKNKYFSKEEMVILEKNLRLLLGGQIKINFLFVPGIEPSKGGKINLVINNILKKNRY